MVIDKCLMEIAVSVRSTICGNEQITAVEIRRIRCDKFNLNRPLGKLTFRNSRCRSGRYGICLRLLSVFMTEECSSRTRTSACGSMFPGSKLLLNGFMVISCGFSFFKMNSICRTGWETITQAVSVVFAEKHCFAVSQANGTFVTGVDAKGTAGTFFCIKGNNSANHKKPPYKT